MVTSGDIARVTWIHPASVILLSSDVVISIPLEKLIYNLKIDKKKLGEMVEEFDTQIFTKQVLMYKNHNLYLLV